MSKDETGGPAFPTGTQITQNPATGETTMHQYLSDGMTLRDYFAAKAMVSFWNDEQLHPSVTKKDAAEWAYAMADAMLEARKS